MADDQFAEFRTPDEMASMSSETLSLRDRVVLDILTARAGGWQRGAEIDYDAVVDWAYGVADQFLSRIGRTSHDPP